MMFYICLLGKSYRKGQVLKMDRFQGFVAPPDRTKIVCKPNTLYFLQKLIFLEEQIIFINVDCLLNPCVKVFEMFVDRYIFFFL